MKCQQLAMRLSLLFVSLAVSSAGTDVALVLEECETSLVGLISTIHSDAERDAAEFKAYEAHVHDALAQASGNMSEMSSRIASLQADAHELQGSASPSEESESEIESIRMSETEEIRTMKNELQAAMNQLKHSFNSFEQLSGDGFLQKVGKRADPIVGIKLGLRLIGALTGKPQALLDVGQTGDSSKTMSLVQSSMKEALQAAEEKMRAVELEERRSLDSFEKANRARLQRDLQSYKNLLEATRVKYEEMSHELDRRTASYHSLVSDRSKDLNLCQEALTAFGSSLLKGQKKKHVSNTQQLLKRLSQDLSRFSPGLSLQLLSWSSQSDHAETLSMANGTITKMITRLQDEEAIDERHHMLCGASTSDVDLHSAVRSVEKALQEEENRVRTLRRDFASAKMQTGKDLQQGATELVNAQNADLVTYRIISTLKEHSIGDRVESRDVFLRVIDLLTSAQSEFRKQMEAIEKEGTVIEQILNRYQDDVERELALSSDALKHDTALLHQLEDDVIQRVHGERIACPTRGKVCLMRASARADQIQALQSALVELSDGRGVIV